MSLGDNAQNTSSLGRTLTDLTTYQAKLSLVTPVVPIGDYLIMATFQFQNPLGQNEDIQILLTEDAITPFYETGRLMESDAGNGVADSQASYMVAVKRSFPFAAAAHTYDLEFRRQGGVAGNDVVILETRLIFFELDATFQEVQADAVQQTFSATYQLAAQLFPPPGALLGDGTFRVGFSMEYRNENKTNKMGVRFRERQDPDSSNVITNLLGDDAGNADELFVNNDGLGDAVDDPWQSLSWWTACRFLQGDHRYTYELHFRETGGPAFTDVDIQKVRVMLWEVP